MAVISAKPNERDRLISSLKRFSKAHLTHEVISKSTRSSRRNIYLSLRRTINGGRDEG
jgi:hypothetical protein